MTGTNRLPLPVAASWRTSVFGSEGSSLPVLASEDNLGVRRIWVILNPDQRCVTPNSALPGSSLPVRHNLKLADVDQNGRPPTKVLHRALCYLPHKEVCIRVTCVRKISFWTTECNFKFGPKLYFDWISTFCAQLFSYKMIFSYTSSYSTSPITEEVKNVGERCLWLVLRLWLPNNTDQADNTNNTDQAVLSGDLPAARMRLSHDWSFRYWKQSVCWRWEKDNNDILFALASLALIITN